MGLAAAIAVAARALGSESGRGTVLLAVVLTAASSASCAAWLLLPPREWECFAAHMSLMRHACNTCGGIMMGWLGWTLPAGMQAFTCGAGIFVSEGMLAPGCFVVGAGALEGVGVGCVHVHGCVPAARVVCLRRGLCDCGAGTQRLCATRGPHSASLDGWLPCLL